MSDVRRPGPVLPSGLNAFLAIDQSALDAIPTGLCVCGADGVLLKYNQRAVELWGRAPRLNDPAELDGGAFRRYAADGSTLPFAASPVAAALRTGATLLGAELTIERPGGSRVPVLMNVAPLQNPASHVEGAVCSFQEYHRAQAHRSRAAQLERKLSAEVERRTLERDRIWNVSEDLFGGAQLRRLFPQHQSGMDAAARLERARNQIHARQRIAPSGRCANSVAGARSSRKACPRSAWKTDSATRTEAGAGCNGR